MGVKKYFHDHTIHGVINAYIENVPYERVTQRIVPNGHLGIFEYVHFINEKVKLLLTTSAKMINEGHDISLVHYYMSSAEKFVRPLRELKIMFPDVDKGFNLINSLPTDSHLFQVNYQEFAIKDFLTHQEIFKTLPFDQEKLVASIWNINDDGMYAFAVYSKETDMKFLKMHPSQKWVKLELKEP